MAPRLIIAGVAAVCASAAQADTVASQPATQLQLSCTGSMFSGTAGATESHISTRGLIDIENRRAGGFGLGRVPVLSVSATEIHFGSPALDDEPRGQRIEGSFDFLSGDLAIVVRSKRRPLETVIRMDLFCRVTEPLF